jgi:hypothetical protein
MDLDVDRFPAIEAAHRAEKESLRQSTTEYAQEAGRLQAEVARLREVGNQLAEVWDAMHRSFATDPRDWGNSGARAAWRYGVICGWGTDDDPFDARSEIAERFPTIDVARMERLHSAREAWAALSGEPT